MQLPPAYSSTPVVKSPPAVQGLDPAMLDRTLEGLDPAQQDEILKQLSDQELEAYANYTSDLRHPTGATVNSQIRGRVGIHPVNDSTPVEQLSDAELETLAAGTKVAAPMAAPGSEGWLSGGLGITARGAMRGAAGMADLALTPVLPEGESVTGAVDELGNKMGLGRPTGPGGRVYSDVVEGVAGALSGGGIAGGIKSLAARAPGTLFERGGIALADAAKSQVGKQAALGGLAGGTAGIVRENGGDERAQIAAALLAGLGPDALIGLKKANTYRRLGEQGVQDMRDRVAAYERVADATPTSGIALDSATRQEIERRGSEFIGTKGIFKPWVDKVGKGIGDFVQEKAAKLGGADSTMAGEKVSRAFEDSYTPATKANIDKAYGEVEKVIPQNARFDLTNLRKQVAQFTGELSTASAGLKVDKNLRGDSVDWKNTLRNIDSTIRKNGGRGMAYKDIKQLRSDIGAQLEDGVLKLQPTGKQRALYRALSEDMDTAAAVVGPQAQEAIASASRIFKNHMDTLDNVASVVDRNGGGEKIFKAAMSGTKDGSSLIAKVYDDIGTPDSRKALTSALLRQMMKTSGKEASFTGNDFNLREFFNKFHAIDPEARKVIFGAHGAEFYNDMELIGKTAASVNQSGLADKRGISGMNFLLYPMLVGPAAGISSLAGGGGLAMTAASTAGGALIGVAVMRALAKKMVDPKTVKWLASTSKIKPSALPTAINVYAQQAKEDGDEDAMKLADEMQAYVAENKNAL